MLYCMHAPLERMKELICHMHCVCLCPPDSWKVSDMILHQHIGSHKNIKYMFYFGIDMTFNLDRTGLISIIKIATKHSCKDRVSIYFIRFIYIFDCSFYSPRLLYQQANKWLRQSLEIIQKYCPIFCFSHFSSAFSSHSFSIFDQLLINAVSYPSTHRFWNHPQI